MSNITNAGLVPVQISANSITPSEPKGAPVAKFGTRVRPIGPATTGTVEAVKIGAISALATDPTTFQSGDTTFAKVTLTVSHLAKRGTVAAPEGNLGLSVVNHAQEALARGLATDILGRHLLAITSGAFGAADVTSQPDAFDIADLSAVAAANNGEPRVALVATAAMPTIAPDLKLGSDNVWRYPAIDAGIYETTLTGDADVAIVAGPEALAYLVERPEVFSTYPPAEVQISEILLPVIQIPAWVCKWYDRSARAWWVSVECLHGVAAADATALSYAATP